jgi:hypothetical protein
MGKLALRKTARLTPLFKPLARLLPKGNGIRSSMLVGIEMHAIKSSG